MNTVLQEHIFPSGQRLRVVKGDLTEERVDAIVNAANSHLQHGGGVAGVISRKGGPQIQDESNRWVRENGPVSHSAPAYTSAGNLPSKYIFHAVGPVWGDGDEDIKLSQAVTGCLKLADQLRVSSIALPAISTGIFGFPKDRAAAVFYKAISDYFQDQPDSQLSLVHLTLFDESTITAFLAEWEARGWMEA